MPEDFLKCVREGGRVITIKIGEDKYRHVCYDHNGKPHYGEKARIPRSLGRR